MDARTSSLLAAARRPRRAGIDAFWPDEGDWFNLFERIKRHQLYYQGRSDDAERPAVEPAAQRLSGHRAVGRLGLVGRHRHVVEDARGADRRRPQLLAEHRPLLGLGHRRLLSEQRADGRALRALVPVRGVLRIVPLARPRLVDAAAVGLGLERHGTARVRQHQRADPPDDRRNILPSEMNNPAIEPIASEVRRAALPADAVHLHAGAGSARPRPAADARDVAALSGRRAARAKGNQFLWGRDLLVAPVFTKGATTRDVYLPAGDWYDWWTRGNAWRRPHDRPRRRSRDDADLRARGCHPGRSDPAVYGRAVSGPTTLRVFPGANGDFTLYDDDGTSQEYLAGRGNWIRMTWNDATRTLTLEPGAPSGATDVVRPRAFRVVLPDGRTNDVSHAGRRVAVAFQERPKIGETITTESGLVYKFTQLGKGPQPQTGDLMVIHGIGTHVDGKEFWNTRTDSSPYESPSAWTA